MKTKRTILYGTQNLFCAFAVILALAFTAMSLTGCSGSGGGGKNLNSATELKEYLDKQPANSPDQPIKVAMKANDMMINDIAKVISESGKYVSLNLSGSPLTEIPNRAFRDCKTLAGITIPNGVTKIGDYAFSGTGLTSITIPNSVTYIHDYTFSGCTNLTSVTIPDSITSIDDGAFRNTGLTSVTIPNSVTSIGEEAFSSCRSLTSVTLEGTIDSEDFGRFHVRIVWTVDGNRTRDVRTSPFDGDLDSKYLAGGIGTYTRTSGEREWTKQ